MRAFPFQDEIVDFVASHDQVFVVEQNRDAQLRTLLVNDAGVNPASLVPVLHYDGTPITARFIADAIAARLRSSTSGRSRAGRPPSAVWTKGDTSPFNPLNQRKLRFNRR